jgi:RNA polymerase sigma factor (sigma-70 family)
LFTARAPEPAPAPDAAAQLDAGQAAAALRRRVERLAPMQRTVVQLRFGEELSIAEIAAATAIGEETVKTHLGRALAHLRREMGSEP